MQATRITTIADFDALAQRIHKERAIARAEWEAAMADNNQTFRDCDDNWALARKFVARALECRGEYRDYLLSQANAALYCNANDHHTSGELVTI